MLMVGTVLGPGTIFLMMVGAVNAITGLSNLNALLLNLIPITIYIIVCMTCKSETQVMLLDFTLNLLKNIFSICTHSCTSH